MMDQATINCTDVVYRDDLYPRFKPDPALIQQYSENLDVLPPIELNQDRILIDGYHRWKAHQTAGAEDVPCIVTQTESEMQLLMLAVQRNALHDKQLTPKEKKRYAVRWWDVLPIEEICQTLSISDRTFREWTQDKRQQQEEEQRQQIFDMWLACCAQKSIAEDVGITQPAVAEKIAEFIENGESAESDNFSNFAPQLYALWNFSKATNEVRHFGNIRPEIIDNLLYYYTDPFDVVFDPFGGGGSTIDKCIERQRRYYVSDLNPIPAREQEIRKHDVTTGFPNGMPTPDLIFLDPPYWKQAAGKYSDDETDLANMDLDSFLDNIAAIAKSAKRKWSAKSNGEVAKPNAKLALIIGPWKDNGQRVDLALLCYARIEKYLRLVERITVPYSTQVHGGAYVANAKERKEILYLTRDLMVFGR